MIAIAAAIGLVFGHILELSLSRLYSDQPLTQPLVRCGNCSTRITAPYLAPVWGWLRYHGRCSGCGAALPPSALLLPLGGMLLFALAYVAMGELPAALQAGFFCTIYLALIFTDIDRRLIPNRIVYPGIIIAALLAWGWPDRSVGSIFAGGLTTFAFAAAVYIMASARGGFGLGDVKMLTLMGLTTGFPYFLPGLFIMALTGGIAALGLIATGRNRLAGYMPYGPFIAIGAIAATLWGIDIWDWYRG